MKEEMRTIGYLCPACHKRVIQQRSVFALSASGAVVSCECGESSLTIEAEENKFRLSVPCGVCGEEHLAECSADKLLHGRGIGLACPDTKMLCCFIGEDYAVEHEMEQLSLAAAKEREQGDDPAAFADSLSEAIGAERERLTSSAPVRPTGTSFGSSSAMMFFSSSSIRTVPFPYFSSFIMAVSDRHHEKRVLKQALKS